MSGGRAGVVLEETLWRHLFTVNSYDGISLTALLLILALGYLYLRRSAMQGFAEDYTGLPARSRFGEGRCGRHP